MMNPRQQYQITINDKGAMVYRQDLDANNSPVTVPVYMNKITKEQELDLVDFLFNYVASLPQDFEESKRFIIYS